MQETITNPVEAIDKHLHKDKPQPFIEMEQNNTAMKKYTFSFTGRQVGAIGSFYKIRRTFEADTLNKAIDEIYKHYEHISFLYIKQGNKSIDLKTIYHD